MVATCQKCHAGATRRFAGYLSHATHHDPQKYPWLFWTFWGMTSLLAGTFLAGGAHTLLWLPRALQMRRELKAEEEAEEREAAAGERTVVDAPKVAQPALAAPETPAALAPDTGSAPEGDGTKKDEGSL